MLFLIAPRIRVKGNLLTIYSTLEVFFSFFRVEILLIGTVVVTSPKESVGAPDQTTVSHNDSKSSHNLDNNPPAEQDTPWVSAQILQMCLRNELVKTLFYLFLR
jgi:hypothetical protein